MTAVLPTTETASTPTSPVVFAWAVGTTVAVIAAAALVPSNDSISIAMFVLVITFLGIPHGAVDHLVERRLHDIAVASNGPEEQARSSEWRFHTVYVLAMLAVGVVWLVAPAVALAGFLVLSAHHFGQSDLAHLRLGLRRQFAVQVSRGVLLVGLPLVAHLTAVSPTIELLSGADPTSWAWLDGHVVAWSALLIGQHVAVGAVVAPSMRDRGPVLREVVSVVVLCSLLVVADPLLGFAVYFGLWHSLNHLHVLAAVLGRGSRALSPSDLARRVAPRTAVSAAGLAALVAGAVVAERTDLVVPMILVFVSMLTLPHMVVVERLWRAQR